MNRTKPATSPSVAGHRGPSIDIGMIYVILSLQDIGHPNEKPQWPQATTVATRSHSGHKHGHGHHHHDNVYLTSTNKNDTGVRITRIGLFSNLGMAIKNEDLANGR